MAFDARDDIRAPVPATRRHVEREGGPLAKGSPADDERPRTRGQTRPMKLAVSRAAQAGGLVGLDRARGCRLPAGSGSPPRELEAGHGLEEAGPLPAARAEPEDDHTEHHR
jgi:hypothetical protein